MVNYSSVSRRNGYFDGRRRRAERSRERRRRALASPLRPSKNIHSHAVRGQTSRVQPPSKNKFLGPVRARSSRVRFTDGAGRPPRPRYAVVAAGIFLASLPIPTSVCGGPIREKCLFARADSADR